MDPMSKFFQLMKVPLSAIFAACVAAAIILYSPDRFLANLGLLEYRDKYRVYFGLGVLLLIASVISTILKLLKHLLIDWILSSSRKERLRNLTMEEIQILGPYIAMKTRTRYLSIQSGVVKGLVHDDIIYRSANVGSLEYGGAAFAHNIQPWAWDYLNKNPKLVHAPE
jgi:hypothetical protein